MEQLALSVRIRKFLEWPFWLSPIWVLLAILLYFFAGPPAAIAVGICLVVYLGAAIFLYYRQRPRIAGELLDFATSYGQVQNRVLREFVLPYALLDLSGNVLWMNDELLSLTGREKGYHRSITTLFPEITMTAASAALAASSASPTNPKKPGVSSTFIFVFSHSMG